MCVFITLLLLFVLVIVEKLWVMKLHIHFVFPYFSGEFGALRLFGAKKHGDTDASPGLERRDEFCTL